MEKITPQSPETQSADSIAENIARLRELFPELVTEGPEGTAINVDVLKQLVGDQTVTDAEEKYGLNWHGKRRARQIALTPSTGTLRPCPEESVDWDTTQNLMIEGDNLEVLKLLQKSYSGRVKLIYIDPPYNTGKDFVYPDNFHDSIRNYMELTGQIEEVANVRQLCDEVFGEENLQAILVWQHSVQPKGYSGTFSVHHNFILCYQRSDDFELGNLDRTDEHNKNYSNPDNDVNGPWRTGDVRNALYRPNLRYNITTPSGKSIPPPANGWRWSKETLASKIQSGEIFFSDDETRIIRKIYLSRVEGRTPETLLFGKDVGTTRDAASELKVLFDGIVPFDTPKPTSLIQHLFKLGQLRASDIVLDFFAGSGTSAHAVAAKNSTDGDACRYILVQLPEPLDHENKDQKTAADYCLEIRKPLNIAELTKERLRRAAKKIRDENPLFHGDLGFRVFKLDSTNIREWDPAPVDLENALLEHTEHIKAGRTEEDLLYELLLKLGLDLCVPMETRSVAAGKGQHQITSIGGGVLMACLSESIPLGDVEALGHALAAWHQELNPAGDTTCVFLDSAFEDDNAKTNMSAILTQHGFTRVRSL